jgi:hypothetical protein
LRRLQEVTGKPGLLARGYVKGHGPVSGVERGGGDSIHWHQGQANFADYRFYSDVSVDNFNAVLFGYAIYYDLAADAAQRAMIAHDVDRLMTHLLDNHYRIIDLNGEVTQYGHVEMDPDPARGDIAEGLKITRPVAPGRTGSLPSRQPDGAARSAHRLSRDGKAAVRRVPKSDARFNNPEPSRDRAYSLERVARQSFERRAGAGGPVRILAYEEDLPGPVPAMDGPVWEMNWMEGSSLFTYMTLAFRRALALRGSPGTRNDTLRYPVDRVRR